MSPIPKAATAADAAQDILALPTVFPAGSRPSLKELQTAIEELTKRNTAIQALNDTLEKDLAAVRVWRDNDGMVPLLSVQGDRVYMEGLLAQRKA